MSKLTMAAFGLMLFGAAASVSHAQSTGSTATPRTSSTREQRRHGERGQQKLFKGITLSAAEKAQVQAVRESYASRTKSMRESMRPAMQEARAARQRGDSAAVKAAFAKTATQREELKALRAQELHDVRAKLSADHQRAFDSNLAMRKSHEGKRGHGGHGRRRAKLR